MFLKDLKLGVANGTTSPCPFQRRVFSNPIPLITSREGQPTTAVVEADVVPHFIKLLESHNKCFDNLCCPKCRVGNPTLTTSEIFETNYFTINLETMNLKLVYQFLELRFLNILVTTSWFLFFFPNFWSPQTHYSEFLNT